MSDKPSTIDATWDEWATELRKRNGYFPNQASMCKAFAEHYAAQQVEEVTRELREELANAKRKADLVRDDVRSLQAERDEARRCLAMVRAGTDDVWRWQGDGSDEADTLACPVVMHPDTLRGLLKAKDELEDIRAELAALRTPPAGAAPEFAEARAQLAGDAPEYDVMIHAAERMIIIAELDRLGKCVRAGEERERMLLEALQAGVTMMEEIAEDNSLPPIDHEEAMTWVDAAIAALQGTAAPAPKADET